MDTLARPYSGGLKCFVREDDTFEMEEPGVEDPPVSSRAATSRVLGPDRVLLGERVRVRAREVAESVVRDLWGDDPPAGVLGAMIVERVLRDAAWASTQLGSWLSTGEIPSVSGPDDVASHGRETAAGYVSMADMTNGYLAWRDAQLRVVADEHARLGLDPGAAAAARAAIRRSCDVVLVNMVTDYDAAKQDLRRRLEVEHAKLRYLALHDPLTGLANRTLLLDRLEHALQRAGRRPETIAVLYLDLNGFKEINDSHGHHVGDQVLVEVGLRLLSLVRASDTVARLGGDEYVILCEQIDGGQAELTRLAERVRAAVARPLPACPGQRVSVSVGTVLAAPGFDTDAMLRAADAAMYDVKHAAEALA